MLEEYGESVGMQIRHRRQMSRTVLVLVFSPSPVGSSGDELKYDYFRDSPMVR